MMFKPSRPILLFFAWVLITNILLGQTITAKEAEKLFKEKQYCRALDYFSKSLSSDPAEVYKKGLCQYHCNQLNAAEQVFTQLAQTKKNDFHELNYWLGRTYQQQQKFQLASDQFKLYMQKAGSKGALVADALLQVQRCTDASFLMRREPWGYLEHLNDKVNSQADELMPIFSPNYDDRVYFTSNVDGKFKVYGAEVGQGTWNPRYLLHETANTGTHVTLLDFNEDGQVAYYLEETYGQVRLLADTFTDQEVTRSGPLQSPLQMSTADHYVQFLFDSVAIFASNRPGGFGGYDLYLSLASRGVWGPAINLGQEVNTSADEISPFFTNDGRELYFSSNRPEDNMGGFDQYRIKVDEKTKQWTKVYNMGPPVNSPADDIGLQIASNGRNAMFASNRKTGLGGYDVYYFFIKQPIVSQFFAYGGLPAVIATLQKERPEVMPTQTVNLPYLLYTEDDNILTAENLTKLDQLTTKLNNCPSCKLDIIVHADNSSGLQNLFFCAKRGEKLLDYLQPKLKISQPIFILGTGAEYPIAKNGNNLGPLPAGQRLNRRIEFNWHGPSVESNQELPQVATVLEDSMYSSFAAFKKGLWFKVFVLTATRPVELSVLGEYPEVTIEKYNTYNGYDYTVGRYSAYSEANQIKQRIRSQGFSEATVYAYLDGRRLTEQDVDLYMNDYPELINFKERKE